VSEGKRAREITLINPYYLNPGMLQRQYDHLEALPEELKSRIRYIVVDDGSPTDPAVKPDRDLGLGGFALYRIDVDVRWNWLACRNLAAAKAKTDWLLMTDIDHMLPEATARRLLDGKLDGRRAYRFSRVDDPDMTPYKPHPNSWLLTRQAFDKVGGYDERFSGYYGSDGEFRDRVTKTLGDPIMLPEVLIRVPREVTPDASTTTYGRKEEQDRDGIQAARARIAKEGGPPLRGSFPWRRVA
jgi:hypothetical protein